MKKGLEREGDEILGLEREGDDDWGWREKEMKNMVKERREMED